MQMLRLFYYFVFITKKSIIIIFQCHDYNTRDTHKIHVNVAIFLNIILQWPISVMTILSDE